jgi:ADP-ribose pyrophosphatase
MKPMKTLQRKQVFAFGKYLTAEAHRVGLPDRRVVEEWLWLKMPAYVNVMAETPSGMLLCFRQTKYAAGETLSLAPVGGYIEPGELPEAAARRELQEEMGCEAEELVSLGNYAVDGNRGAGTAHLFLARGAQKTREPIVDDLEEQELLAMTRDDVRTALARGEFRILSWAAAASLALLYLDAKEAATRG